MELDLFNQILYPLGINMFNGLIKLWPFWALIACAVIVKLSHSLYRLHKLNKAGLPEIDKMSGTEFELFLVQLFRRLGYKVEHVGGMADYGADLIIEKDNIRTVVQAKCWNHPVNVKTIQEIYTSKAHYNATEAMAVTNSRYTSNANELASENHVELIDRYKLATLILKK